MTAKASNSNGCLIVQVEAQSIPEQNSLTAFIKNGLLSLKPNNVQQVVVRAQVSGQTAPSWQDSFELGPQAKEPVSPASIEVAVPSPVVKRMTTNYTPIKPATPKRGPLVEFLQTRNAERIGLVLGTAVLTSACWLGVGALGANSTRSAQNTRSPIAKLVSNTYTIQGTLQLVDSDIGGTASNCYGTGGYDDIEAGMPVTIRDGQGTILATGQVGTGSQPSGSEYSSVVCTFEFQVENVPKADFYAISVGRRGELNYSFAEIEQKGWKVELSLGT